jgi:hypothetical protein
VPYQLRLGAAVPTQNRLFFARPSVQLYLVGGVSF